VNGKRNVVVVHGGGLAGVYPHADPGRPVVRPFLHGKGTLPVDTRSDRFRRLRERYEQRVALGVPANPIATTIPRTTFVVDWANVS
jgi:hypothetical protein